MPPECRLGVPGFGTGLKDRLFEDGNETSGGVKGRRIFGQLSNCCLVKNAPALFRLVKMCRVR